jgi:large subunit ribosomal protein L5
MAKRSVCAVGAAMW